MDIIYWTTFVYPVGGQGRWGGVYPSSYKFHFTKEHDNLVEDPSNIRSITIAGSTIRLVGFPRNILNNQLTNCSFLGGSSQVYSAAINSIRFKIQLQLCVFFCAKLLHKWDLRCRYIRQVSEILFRFSRLKQTYLVLRQLFNCYQTFFMLLLCLFQKRHLVFTYSTN